MRDFPYTQKPLLEKGLALAKELRSSGNIMEFGVGSGRTFEYLARHKRKQDWLVGFDAFRGLPEEAKGVWRPERHAANRLKFDRRIVQQRMSGVCCEIVEGWFSDTLTPERRKTYGPVILVNMDCDLYSSTILALDFVGPMLVDGALIYFDDWKDPRDDHPEPWGEHRAFAEWVRKTDVEFSTAEANEHNQQLIRIHNA